MVVVHTITTARSSDGAWNVPWRGVPCRAVPCRAVDPRAIVLSLRGTTRHFSTSRGSDVFGVFVEVGQVGRGGPHLAGSRSINKREWVSKESYQL
ncbi:hypothetical protein E2C01_067143 [Portunus trituberculatus]|uniref:Uncharacterized protein n=1 Tax=Portunus trituberculatus TaxID=210409 RepID=A0A5B7HST8_PORTR|nr:hypothetical protein [Portunus trituberculatus]